MKVTEAKPSRAVRRVERLVARPNGGTRLVVVWCVGSMEFGTRKAAQKFAAQQMELFQ